MTEDDRPELLPDDRTGNRIYRMRDGDIDALLRSARDQTAPIGADLRARIRADASALSPVSHSSFSLRRWLGGLIAMPGAALLGLWVGLSQPSVVLGLMPQTSAMGGDTTQTEAGDPGVGQTSAETALLDDVFGTTWASATLEDTE